MTKTSKIPNRYICDKCEQDHLDAWRQLEGDGLKMAVTFCPHTSRSVIFEGLPGDNPDVKISHPADRDTLEVTWRSYRDKRIAAQQYARELANGGGTRH